MGWWLDKAQTQWECKPNETKTCQYCSQGLTPQQHGMHKEVCACKKCIELLTHQQQQQEAKILHQAITNAKCNCAMTTNKHSWLLSTQLFHSSNSCMKYCSSFLHCMPLLVSDNADPLDFSNENTPLENMCTLLAR